MKGEGRGNGCLEISSDFRFRGKNQFSVSSRNRNDPSESALIITPRRRSGGSRLRVWASGSGDWSWWTRGARLVGGVGLYSFGNRPKRVRI